MSINRCKKKFEVRFYVCVDVEMLIRHSLKNLMERDRDSQQLFPRRMLRDMGMQEATIPTWRVFHGHFTVGPPGMIRQIYSVFTKVAVELVELVETRRRTCCELTYNL